MTTATITIPALMMVATEEDMEEIMVANIPRALHTAEVVMEDPTTSPAHSNMPSPTQATQETPIYSALPSDSLLVRSLKSKKRMLMRTMLSNNIRNSTAMETTKNKPTPTMSALPLLCRL